MSALHVKNLCYFYDRKTSNEKEALIDVSMDIEQGEIIALVGKTGSGKSTLVQNIDALLTPTTGVITYPNGIVVDQTPVVKKNGKIKYKKPKKLKDWKSLRKMIGLMFQFSEMQLFETSVLKDVMVGPENFGMDKGTAQTNAQNALLSVGIPTSYFSRSPFELSGGEKRRVAIAGILAFNPEILILDEPTVGLDPEGAKEIMDSIMAKNAEGMTIVFITHDMEFALKNAHRMAVISDGKLIAYKKPYEVFQDQEVMDKASLVPPKAFEYALKLKEGGLDIDLEKVKDSKSLAEEIKRCRV